MIILYTKNSTNFNNLPHTPNMCPTNDITVYTTLFKYQSLQ